MDYTRLGYLYFARGNKVNYKHSIYLLRLSSLCIYIFESLAKAIKQSYTNYINFIIEKKLKYRNCTKLLRLKKSQLYSQIVR